MTRPRKKNTRRRTRDEILTDRNRDEMRTVAISKDQHKELRIYAAKHDLSMRRALETIIDAFMWEQQQEAS